MLLSKERRREMKNPIQKRVLALSDTKKCAKKPHLDAYFLLFFFFVFFRLFEVLHFLLSLSLSMETRKKMCVCAMWTFFVRFFLRF